MARKQARPKASRQVTLQLHQIICRECGSQMRMGHHSHRTVTTLQGVTRLTLKVYRCRNQMCSRFQQPTQPEEEGRWALPHGEFGLDVIALVGMLRYQKQRSIPQIHEELLGCVKADASFSTMSTGSLNKEKNNKARLYACWQSPARIFISQALLSPNCNAPDFRENTLRLLATI